MDFLDDEHVRAISFTQEDYENMEKVLTAEKNKSLPTFWQNKYRKDQGRNWELFYRRNSANFFKDRSWLSREFGLENLCKIADSNAIWKVVDIGCGVGNGIFPILKAYDNVEAYCFDVSAKATELLKARYLEEKDRLKGRIEKLGVWDMISQDRPSACEWLEGGGKSCDFQELGEMDAGLLLFVLSAVPPEDTNKVVQRIGSLIKPGGVLMVRDYGRYDQKEIRFASRSDAKLDDHFYVRQDGTLALYFDKARLDQIMIELGGFDIVSSDYITRQFVNRKTLQTLNRCWIQAVYRKREETS